MKAQIIRRFGGPDAFETADMPSPSPGPGDVLIRAAAASINPVDYKIRAAGPGIAPDLPAILGCDVAGEVAAVGAEVTDFAVGDLVYGCVGGVKGLSGTYAEQVVADQRLIAKAPKALSLREAAALPLATITAWDGLDRAGVGAGTRLLVRGGAGGVGHLVLQLAKARGAMVVATVSSDDKAKLAQALGADATPNYTVETPEAIVAAHTDGDGFDAVYDATGGRDLEGALAFAGLNGQVVTIVSQFTADLTLAHQKGLSLHVVFMLIPMLFNRGRQAHGAILRQTAALVDAGQVRPHLDPRRFTLDDVADAHRHLESGQAVGKVVVDIA